jgi:hypothetical protein
MQEVFLTMEEVDRRAREDHRNYIKNRLETCRNANTCMCDTLLQITAEQNADAKNLAQLVSVVSTVKDVIQLHKKEILELKENVLKIVGCMIVLTFSLILSVVL